jgi:hypothetical protein
LVPIRNSSTTSSNCCIHDRNPWIYSSNLYLSSGGIEHENVPPRKRRNAAFLDEEEIESISGTLISHISACLPHPRQLKIEEVLHLRIYKKTEISSTFITDTLVLPEKQLAYVVTDTYMLHEVLFTYKDFRLDTARLTSKDSIDLKTILRQHNPNPIKFGTAKFLNVDVTIPINMHSNTIYRSCSLGWALFCWNLGSEANRQRTNSSQRRIVTRSKMCMWYVGNSMWPAGMKASTCTTLTT